MVDSDIQDTARLMLQWYAAMGVDCAVEPRPIDWLEHGPAAPGADLMVALRSARTAEPAAQPGAPQYSTPGPRGSRAEMRPPTASPTRPAPAAPASGSPRTFPTASPDAAQGAARDTAAGARSLDALAAALDAFDGCALKATAKNLCFYRGAAAARVMLIGEAPGRDEDLEGRPFVGRAGQLLDRMLAAAGLGEAECHITNIVYWRPPGNRTPTPQEALVCRPFLERQIELVAPDFIVALGGAAAKHLLGVEDGIMRLRGRWRDVELGGRPRRLMATLHPAYLLRTPAQKRLAWRDMLAVATALES